MEQLKMDFGSLYYEFNKPIRLIELFAGIGTQAMALEELGINFERYDIVEFDKYCNISYNAIHGTNHITKDIRDVKVLDIKETHKYDYIVSYSFPCTDISLAGKGKGMAKGDNTRSSLLWEVQRLLDASYELPRVLLLENVSQIISKTHKPQFNIWINYLASKGYSNHILRMNAKDYGVAQNRDRVYMLSILGNYDYKHPTPIKLDKCLKNYLEDNVDNKYYLKQSFIDQMLKKVEKYNRSEKFLGGIKDENNIARTITTKMDRPKSTYIMMPEATKKGYDIAREGDGVYINRPHQKRGVVQKGMIQTLKTNGNDLGVVVNQSEKDMITDDGNIKRYLNSDVVDIFNVGDAADLSFPNGYNKANRVTKGYVPTLTVTTSKNIVVKVDSLTIRRLTPLECWRLMGIKDEYYYRAVSAGISNSQLYKQAGNAIVVDVLVAIFKNLFEGGKENDFKR